MKHVGIDRDFKELSSKFKKIPSQVHLNVPTNVDDFNAMSSGQVIQLCSACQIDFYQTLALILKKAWAVLLKENPSFNVTDLMPELKYRFNPDTGSLFDAFERQDAWASREGYAMETFDTLVQEMILADIHLAAFNSKEIGKFTENARRPLRLFNGCAKEQIEDFWTQKSTWLQMQETLSENLLLLERRRLENANITHKWMMIFGKVYLELQQQVQRYRLLNLRVELLETDPDLSRRELDEKVQGVAREMEKKLKNLKLQVLTAPYLFKKRKAGEAVFSKISEFRAEQKKILRELWLLLHPDQLRNKKEYAKLTEKQQQQLKALWHKTMEIRMEEIGFDEDQVGFEYRSLYVLTDVLDTARKILENAGIETDVRFIINGETIEEQLEWLTDSIKRLEFETENVVAELKALFEDREILEREALLASPPKKQEEVKSEMIHHSKKYAKDAGLLEEKLEAFFKKQ